MITLKIEAVDDDGVDTSWTPDLREVRLCGYLADEARNLDPGTILDVAAQKLGDKFPECRVYTVTGFHPSKSDDVVSIAVVRGEHADGYSMGFVFPSRCGYLLGPTGSTLDRI